MGAAAGHPRHRHRPGRDRHRVYGERGTSQLLVFSQVILSMQLPFAVIPLVRFVSDRRKMGEFVIPRGVAVVAWIVAGIIVALNVKLLFETFFG